MLLFSFNTDTRRNTQQVRPGRSVTSRIWVCMYVCVCVVTYIYIYIYTHTHTHIQGGPVEIQTPAYPGTWLVATWPAGRLCYCPAVFFRHLSLIAVSFTQAKIRGAFQKCYYLFIFFFFYIFKVAKWNFVTRGVSVILYNCKKIHEIQ